ncbi:hypothetical protein [Rhodopirellula sp. MGV]|uniref:hypothetical protein n=1 Tax=Rhodopirellula sp. MGV TaxID=2023130 RepID=UPI000B96D52A|nr:hypothetical protein [Rhodopirellula sp. MGV]OYP35180.1 hypothetical protein CGZ80_12330 [Rhodopirellula sp. MGV]PNY37806.1 hypothetical protein C2E31_05970 [Rhodopirellula baltica]
MNETNTERVTCKCPGGHKVRGGSDLIGKTVRCPRCKEKFVFGYQIRETVTDTAVVRMLGDFPSLPVAPIAEQPTMRPCGRCGIAISTNASVCKHCQCYVGHLPDFFARLSNPKGGSNHN